MTITPNLTDTTEQTVVGLCRKYVDEHGIETDDPAFLRLQADVWDAFDRRPNPLDLADTLGAIQEDVDVDRGNFLPGEWPVSHPEHGPAVATWKDRNRRIIRVHLLQAVGAL